METPVRYRPPQQDRSRRALERLLVAAEDVLAARGFDEFTMNAVADEANVSVGAIYRRFEGREQLLAAVNERMLDRMERDLEAALQAAEPTLEGLVRALVRASVENLEGNRAFPTIYAPAMALTPRVHAAIETRRRLFLEVAERHLGEIRRTDPRAAVSMVQAIVTGSCVHRASQGPAVVDGLSWDEFAVQLEQLAMTYLLAPDPLV